MSTRIPHTRSVVSYAYTVSANGIELGTIQGFNPTANRTLERVREIRNEIDDLVEIVPGRTEFSISIDRFETYEKNMMTALGYAAFEDISQIVTPIQIVEEFRNPVTGAGRRIRYQNCWPQTWGKPVREGTITITENMNLWVEKITASNI